MIETGEEMITDGAEDLHLTKNEERQIIAKTKPTKLSYQNAHEMKSKF